MKIRGWKIFEAFPGMETLWRKFEGDQDWFPAAKKIDGEWVSNPPGSSWEKLADDEVLGDEYREPTEGEVAMILFASREPE